jgi:hypothetical protein
MIERDHRDGPWESTTDLGKKVTYAVAAVAHWLCLTCTGSTIATSSADHEGCVHIQRVKRYGADHPEQQAAA